MKFSLPKLYAITDQQLSGLSHAEQVTRLARAGVNLIQLRDKHSSPREFFHEASKALEAGHRFGVKIIINDRADIAFCLGADGVHLGQDDLPAAAARELLGPAAVIGFSTHSVGQAIAAANLPIDYLAFGPIFPTLSKSDTEPVVGLEGLREVRAKVLGKPLVAIGGITSINAASALAAGADSVAAIGALIGAENIDTLVRSFSPSIW